MNSVLLVRLKTLRWVVSTSADYSSLSLLVSCWEKVVFPPREGCRTGRKTRAKRKAPCQHSQAQPSAAKAEGSCHREPMGPWLGLWGSFCSGVGESKLRVGKESLKGIWGRYREQETAEITWEQAARWLGCQKKSLGIQRELCAIFCNLKATECCYIENQPERKTHSTRAIKEYGAVLFTNLISISFYSELVLYWKRVQSYDAGCLQCTLLLNPAAFWDSKLFPLFRVLTLKKLS